MNIDKLSDIFSGKVPGLNKPINFEAREQRRSEIEVYPEINFNQKIPNFNFKTGMNMKGPIEDKVFGNIEKQSWRRMKKQKGLSLFGDADKDGVFNVFDCAPMNKFLQANIHKELEVYDTTPLPKDKAVNVTPGKVAWEDTKEYAKSAPKKLWLGLTQPIRDRKAEREYILKVREAAREGELARIKQGKVGAMQKYLPKGQTPVRDVTEALSQGASAIVGPAQAQTQGQKIANLIGLQRNNNQQIAYAAAQPSQGLLPDYGQTISQPQPGQVVSQPQPGQPVSQQGTSGPKGAPPGPGYEWSEASKRWVTYKRGKYDKKQNVQYTPQQQSQQY